MRFSYLSNFELGNSSVAAERKNLDSGNEKRQFLEEEQIVPILMSSNLQNIQYKTGNINQY